jgi:GNAT superfamily N-acetyltransferase
LARDHLLDGFVCRSPEQTRWLGRHARQSTSMGLTRVFVVTERDQAAVVAYYAWTMAQIEREASPARLVKGAGRYPQPVALLARLGVHPDHEGRGLGAALLREVLLRLVAVGDEIGCRGLLIHAETDEARGFYKHLIPELEPSPTDGLHLLLLMKDVLRSLR